MSEKIFTKYSVRKLFFTLTIPGIISMVFSSICIMIDGAIVGNYIGTNGLVAINLVFPILTIMFALPNLLAVGSSVKISISLGQGDKQKASKIFSATFVSIIVLGVVISAIGFLTAKPIIFALISDGVVAQMAYDYTVMFLYLMPVILPFFAMDNYLKIVGQVNYSMIANLLVVVINIIIDVVFIIWLDLGIFYAGIATSVAMATGSIITILPFVFKNMSLKFVKPTIDFKELGSIIYVGLSDFLSVIAGSVIIIVTNAVLLNIGGTVAVAAYSIVMYIENFIFSIVYGMQDSLQAAISYNAGKNDKKRINRLFRYATIFSFSICLIAVVALNLFPETISSFFSEQSDTQVIKLSVTAIMFYAPSLLFNWFTIVSCGFMTAFKRPKECLIIMTVKAIILPLILLYSLTSFYGVNGAFLSLTINAVLVCMLCLAFWIKISHQYRKRRAHIIEE